MRFRGSALFLAIACLMAAPTAIASADNGQPGRLVNGHHDIDAVSQCELLPGNAREGERAGCIACVTRKPHHHWIPEYPPAERCQLDDDRS